MTPLFIILDTAAKAQHLNEVDPHGFIITIVSVSVVFSALILLYCAYTMVGKISTGGFKLPKKSGNSDEIAAAIALALEMDGGSDEEQAAIALALHRYLNDQIHDTESYIITIKRK